MRVEVRIGVTEEENEARKLEYRVLGIQWAECENCGIAVKLMDLLKNMSVYSPYSGRKVIPMREGMGPGKCSNPVSTIYHHTFRLIYSRSDWVGNT